MLTLTRGPRVFEYMARIEPTSSSAATGAWLRKNREARGLTLEALADMAGVHWTYVSKIERSEKSPSRKVIEKLAAALSPEDASDETRLAILNEGLTARGFLPADAPEDDEERHRMELVYQAYKGTKGPIRDAANALLGLQNDLTGNEMSMEDIARITGQAGGESTIGKRAK